VRLRIRVSILLPNISQIVLDNLALRNYGKRQRDGSRLENRESSQ